METPELQIEEELLLARQSRLEGNEGRARVCARRAAGAAVKEYLLHKGLSPTQENAIQSLLIFGQMEGLPVRVKNAVNWLVQRVDQDNNLPPGVDLIQEARVIIQYIGSDG